MLLLLTIDLQKSQHSAAVLSLAGEAELDSPK
jgi:hypothetical protein